MDSDTYQELRKMYTELCEERAGLLKKIDENIIMIREADCHRDSILNKEYEDFKVFSPRTVEDIHRDELELLEKKKDEYQQENNKLYHQRNKIDYMIGVLDKVISDGNGSKNNIEILSVQERERQRIARDLHDTSLQNLAHLIHKIELGTLFIDQDPVRAKLELAVASKNLREIINDIRNTIFNLRPMTFDDLGLKTAFERLIFQLNKEEPLELDLQIDDISCESELAMVTIYRVAHESLMNIYKHAEADKVKFHCRQEGNLCIIDIEDNGKGFQWDEVEKKEGRHFGLSLMKERIRLLDGKLELSTEINKGTKIRIEVPLV